MKEERGGGGEDIDACIIAVKSGDGGVKLTYDRNCSPVSLTMKWNFYSIENGLHCLLCSISRKIDQSSILKRNLKAHL